ncbi:hypothetical protein ANCCAN_04038 [Ancylostoma caninum]|uniref:Uncharacterized protein n=1 Tax=Ancylostoma caninum TaxID=29170 RepID=A0A368H3D9_ANCCA|nr:hypothetical protein ANCCAN_04038 [Ancylostoma caninum]
MGPTTIIWLLTLVATVLSAPYRASYDSMMGYGQYGAMGGMGSPYGMGYPGMMGMGSPFSPGGLYGGGIGGVGSPLGMGLGTSSYFKK